MPAQTFDTVPHLAIVAHGSLPGAEQWSCTLRTTKVEATIGQTLLQTLTTAAVAAWRSLIVDAQVMFSTGVVLSGVTTRALDSRGITQSQAEAGPLTTGAGIGTIQLPNQCSIVATLVTARAGRTGKGRIYLPVLAPPFNTGTDGGLAGNYVDVVATRVKGLLDALNTALAGITDTPKVGVQSKTASSQLGGTYTGAAVTQVRVGSIIDTQRRRRNSLHETYVTKALA